MIRDDSHNRLRKLPHSCLTSNVPSPYTAPSSRLLRASLLSSCFPTITAQAPGCLRHLPASCMTGDHSREQHHSFIMVNFIQPFSTTRLFVLTRATQHSSELTSFAVSATGGGDTTP